MGVGMRMGVGMSMGRLHGGAKEDGRWRRRGRGGAAEVGDGGGRDDDGGGRGCLRTVEVGLRC